LAQKWLIAATGCGGGPALTGLRQKPEAAWLIHRLRLCQPQRPHPIRTTGLHRGIRPHLQSMAAMASHRHQRTATIIRHPTTCRRRTTAMGRHHLRQDILLRLATDTGTRRRQATQAMGIRHRTDGHRLMATTHHRQRPVPTAAIGHHPASPREAGLRGARGSTPADFSLALTMMTSSRWQSASSERTVAT